MQHPFRSLPHLQQVVEGCSWHIIAARQCLPDQPQRVVDLRGQVQSGLDTLAARGESAPMLCAGRCQAESTRHSHPQHQPKQPPAHLLPSHQRAQQQRHGVASGARRGALQQGAGIQEWAQALKEGVETPMPSTVAAGQRAVRHGTRGSLLPAHLHAQKDLECQLPPPRRLARLQVEDGGCDALLGFGAAALLRMQMSCRRHWLLHTGNSPATPGCALPHLQQAVVQLLAANQARGMQLVQQLAGIGKVACNER